ncbi:MAG: hypothetical protein H6R14_1841 [Proteobacteria bacterium]|nr:hypothetical protein [Pseudomonadota bacterium]
MREADAFLGNQPADHVGLVTAGVDLLDAHHRRQVREAPGMDVEHRRHRHIHVFAVDVALGVGAAERRGAAQRVQHELAMAEIDALRVAGRAGRVEGRRLRVFVEIGEVVGGRCLGQHGLVLGGHRDRHSGHLGLIGEEHEGPDRFQRRRNLREDREEFAVDQQHVGLGVVQRVQDLLRAQADIHRLQDRPHHRHGEEAFEVAMAVPVHHRHGLPGLDAQPGQAVGQPADALVERAVVVAQPALVRDFLFRRDGQRRQQQLLDEQRILIGRRRGLDEFDWHASLPVLLLF